MLLGSVMYAKEMNLLVDFYQLLGFSVDTAEPGFTILTRLGTELSIIQAPEVIAAEIEIENPPVSRTETPIKLVFVVDSIEAVAEQLNKRGGRMDRGQARWQLGDFYVQDAVDPEGNIFQLRERMS